VWTLVEGGLEVSELAQRANEEVIVATEHVKLAGEEMLSFLGITEYPDSYNVTMKSMTLAQITMQRGQLIKGGIQQKILELQRQHQNQSIETQPQMPLIPEDSHTNHLTEEVKDTIPDPDVDPVTLWAVVTVVRILVDESVVMIQT